MISFFAFRSFVFCFLFFSSLRVRCALRGKSFFVFSFLFFLRPLCVRRV
jgi:hypothetical protein